MKETSNTSVGDKQVSGPGIRFHPTDEELVMYYLKWKTCGRRLKPDIIGDTDVCKWDPEDLPGQSKLRTGDRQWFFFSPRDRKYPNGARSNRAAPQGYWKATGNDRYVISNSRKVGVKKTLVFYRGRARSGERTDWVMHEYTLDEEELKRCQTAGDYVLYKVFKKSGSGPQNGEQYGAPFKEEDWAEDEFAEGNICILRQENPANQHNEVAHVDKLRVNSQVQSPLNDNEEIINRIAEELSLLPPPIADYTLELPQVFGEVSHSTMVDPSVKDANFTERSMVSHPSSHQFGVDGNFDFTEPASSILQAPELTSAPNFYEQNRHISEEGFLQIDDLIGPEPTPLNIQKPTETLRFDELDGLSEHDLFHDATMFLPDMGPIDQSHPSSQQFGADGSFDFTEPASSILQAPELTSAPNIYEQNRHISEEGFLEIDDLIGPEPTPLNVQFDELDGLSELDLLHDATMFVRDMGRIDQETVSNPDMNNLVHEMVNELYYELLPPPDDAYQIDSHLWTHDLRSNVFTPTESNLGVVYFPTPGVVCPNYCTNIPTEATLNQSGLEGDSEQNRFTSAFWAFEESIPTTPASALENALVNRAFERMSSFSRVRIKTINTNVAAGNGATTARKGSKSRGFFLFSVLGVIFAMLWVLMKGKTAFALGRYISL